jgi:hypothetical protein
MVSQSVKSCSTLPEHFFCFPDSLKIKNSYPSPHDFNSLGCPRIKEEYWDSNGASPN